MIHINFSSILDQQYEQNISNIIFFNDFFRLDILKQEGNQLR